MMIDEDEDECIRERGKWGVGNEKTCYSGIHSYANCETIYDATIVAKTNKNTSASEAKNNKI